MEKTNLTAHSCRIFDQMFGWQNASSSAVLWGISHGSRKANVMANSNFSISPSTWTINRTTKKNALLTFVWRHTTATRTGLNSKINLNDCDIHTANSNRNSQTRNAHIVKRRRNRSPASVDGHQFTHSSECDANANKRINMICGSASVCHRRKFHLWWLCCGIVVRSSRKSDQAKSIFMFSNESLMLWRCVIVVCRGCRVFAFGYSSAAAHPSMNHLHFDPPINGATLIVQRVSIERMTFRWWSILSPGPKNLKESFGDGGGGGCYSSHYRTRCDRSETPPFVSFINTLFIWIFKQFI